MSVIIVFPFKSIPQNSHKQKHNKRPSTKIDGLPVGLTGWINNPVFPDTYFTVEGKLRKFLLLYECDFLFPDVKTTIFSDALCWEAPYNRFGHQSVPLCCPRVNYIYHPWHKFFCADAGVIISFPFSNELRLACK